MQFNNHKLTQEQLLHVFGSLMFETLNPSKIHFKNRFFLKPEILHKYLFSLLFFFSCLSNYSQDFINQYKEILSTSNTVDEINSVLCYLDDTTYIPSIFPLKNSNDFRISSGFGMRFHRLDKKHKPHFGIDLAVAVGSLVVATADGVVDNVQFLTTGYGRNILVTHQYGFQTRYCHLAIIFVEKNQVVKKGEVIGMVGSTGKSTGNHLHYEVLKNKNHLDPAPFLLIDFNKH